MLNRLIRVVPVCVLVAGGGAGVAMATRTATEASAATVKTANNAKYGTVLVAANGRTLYRFTVDKGRSSSCTGSCLQLWPKLMIKSGAKPTAGSGVTSSMLGTTNAGHGMAQVTYGGHPLYFFSGDKKAGQANGEGIATKWYVVSANGALVKHAMTTTNTTTTPPTTTTSGGGGGGWG